MYYLETKSRDPYYNLAFEEYVFEKLDRSHAYFLLWQNSNTIVVGKYQNTAEEINQGVVYERGIRVARRLSGGGAVYHDDGNLNFTFIVDAGNIEDFQFEAFVKPVVKTLEKMGVKAEFNGRNDITIDDMKFSGNSQYMKHGRIMHHGCIMLDSNLASVADALRVRAAKFESKSVKSVRSRVTTINAHTDRKYTMEEFKKLLVETIAETNVLEKMELTEEQKLEVEQLRKEKYATWEWNYGKSPEYNMQYEKKFPSGLVSVYLNADSGRIRDIHFYGDFFGNGDIHELEEKLKGQALDMSLEKTLESAGVENYMAGITAKDIAEMLRG